MTKQDAVSEFGSCDLRFVWKLEFGNWCFRAAHGVVRERPIRTEAGG